MITPETFYVATCDNCGKQWSNYDGICAYRERWQIEESTSESEWKEVDGKLCCPECYQMNDKDEYEIISSRTKQQEGLFGVLP